MSKEYKKLYVKNLKISISSTTSNSFLENLETKTIIPLSTHLQTTLPILSTTLEKYLKSIMKSISRVLVLTN